MPSLGLYLPVDEATLHRHAKQLLSKRYLSSLLEHPWRQWGKKLQISQGRASSFSSHRQQRSYYKFMWWLKEGLTKIQRVCATAHLTSSLESFVSSSLPQSTSIAFSNAPLASNSISRLLSLCNSEAAVKIHSQINARWAAWHKLQTGYSTIITKAWKTTPYLLLAFLAGLSLQG